MPLFALNLTDKSGMLETRKAVRPEHLEWLKSSPELKLAGPVLDAAGDACGSLLVIDVADREAAEAWAAQDPYAKAGIFASLDIRRWNHVLGSLG